MRRILITLLAAASAVALLHNLVLEQYLFNRYLRAATAAHDSKAPPHRVRVILDLLERRHWDPYLRGRRDLERARWLKSQGKLLAASEAYVEALTGRVGPEALVEVGLFEWERGNFEEGREFLLRAAEFSVALIRRLPDRQLQQEILELVELESDNEKAR